MEHAPTQSNPRPAPSHPGRTILIVTIVLMLLLGLTTGISFIKLGPATIMFSLLIAAAKAAIVAIWFMELRKAAPTVRLFACAMLGWLLMLFAGTLADYFSRGY